MTWQGSQHPHHTLRRRRKRLLYQLEPLLQLDLFRKPDEDTVRTIAELKTRIADISRELDLESRGERSSARRLPRSGGGGLRVHRPSWRAAGPVCLVARELRSGRRFRLWQDQFGPAPPYATGPDVLFVAFYASAELGCYRVLGWPMPERILDLFTEFRDRTNGLPTPAGSSLLGALTYFGLDAMGAAEKKEMQEAIGNGTWRGRFTPDGNPRLLRE